MGPARPLVKPGRTRLRLPHIAGVHWRSDATESLRLGEAVAIQRIGFPLPGRSALRQTGAPLRHPCK